MTNEEALKLFQDHKYMTDYSFQDEMSEIAISAIEKQIPKEPCFEGDGYADGQMVYDVWRCPNCDTAYEVDYDDYEYCPNCGQKIDWSEVSE